MFEDLTCLVPREPCHLIYQGLLTVFDLLALFSNLSIMEFLVWFSALFLLFFSKGSSPKFAFVSKQIEANEVTSVPPEIIRTPVVF